MCRITKLGFWVLVCLVTACTQFPSEKSKSQNHGQENSAPTKPTSELIQTDEYIEQQKAIATLLSDADYAFSQKQYLNPVNDNAHDRYRSVLLMEPTNEHAKQGLQMIAMKYVDLARSAAIRGNFKDAQTWLDYARSMGDNPLVQDETESLRKQMLNVGTSTGSTDGSEWVLDAKQLQSKDSGLIQKLATLAKKAKDTDQFVLIIARSDAEGRWIYQQMRTAVPGYLVRGDIRLGTPARVKLVKSLE